MKIIEVSERSIVDIPLSELLLSGGKLKIRADLTGKGLVELQQAQNTLKLRVNGLIGRLPITDNLALDIKPKFPISNLNRMIYASKVELSNPFYFDRPYASFKSQEYLPIPLVRSYAKYLSDLITEGLYREYIYEVTNSSPKPKINFIKTHQKYWSKSNQTKAVVERFDYSINNLPNQCLKLAAMKSLSLAKNISQLKECVSMLAENLRQLERVDLISPQKLQGDLQRTHNKIPSFRSDYSRALTLALEIIGNSDVSLETSNTGLSLESYIICLDNVFESYLRQVLSKIDLGINDSIVALDGNNKRHQYSLFRDNNQYKIKPDLIFKNHRNVFMIGDAKYKIKPQEEDRYQVITHALSYGAKQALLIYPQGASQRSGLYLLGNIGATSHSIAVYEYHFNLAADLENEENLLRDAVSNLFKNSDAMFKVVV